MMKKLLVLLLVLSLSGVASAVPCALQLMAPLPGAPGSSTNRLGIGQPLRVYIATDSSGLGGLAVTVTLTGNGQITGGILAAEAAGYGGSGTYYSPPDIWFRVGSDGWQSSLSFNTITTATTADIGMGQAGNTVYGATTSPVILFSDAPGNGVSTNTPIAYIDIECLGVGDVTLTMTTGSTHGSWTFMDDGVTAVTNMGSPITIYQVPEPMTIALLGLGSLILLRRRK
jgi:hypothetical protein